MKNSLILSALLIVNANAYECSTKASNGVIFTTISNTFKDNGNTKSMWIESKKIVKGKTVGTSKAKIEIQPEKMLRTSQSISYDENGNIKNTYNGMYEQFSEVVPDSMGEWMWYIITNWKYALNTPAKDQKTAHNNCLFFGYNEIAELPIEEYQVKKEPSMTPEETQRWLEENDPRPKGSK